MLELPFITAVLTVPGFSWHPDQTAATSSQPDPSILSIGLVLDGERVAWGVCPFVPGRPFDIDTARNSIEQHVAPALQGERLANFRDLAAKIDALTETVTVHEPLPQPEDDNQATKFSRRDLFSGRLWSPGKPGLPNQRLHDPTEAAPLTREITVKRPIDAAIRYGVSQALLAAVATMQNKTPAEMVAAEYDVPGPLAAVASHAWVRPPAGDAAPAVSALLSRQVASLGYTIAANNDKAPPGVSAESVQQQVRWLQTQIAAAGPAYEPVIHLDLRGEFGRLFDANPGKILGALVGLEQAAAPYPVRVVDPAVMDSRPAQIKILRQLKGYLRLRRMRLQLAASAWVDSSVAVADFIEAEAVHAIQLNTPQLGSLHNTIEAVLAGREQGMATLLAGNGWDDGHSARILAHVALAVRPELIIAAEGAGGTALLDNEMARTLAGLKQ